MKPFEQGFGAVQIWDGFGSGSGELSRLRLRLRVKCPGGSDFDSGSDHPKNDQCYEKT